MVIPPACPLVALSQAVPDRPAEGSSVRWGPLSVDRRAGSPPRTRRLETCASQAVGVGDRGVDAVDANLCQLLLGLSENISTFEFSRLILLEGF